MREAKMHFPEVNAVSGKSNHTVYGKIINSTGLINYAL